MGRLHKALVVQVGAHDDARGVQVVVQCLGLPQKFRAEQDVVRAEFFPHAGRVSHRDGGLDDHDGVWVVLHDQLDDGLHRGSVKVLGLAVVVGGGRNDDEIRTGVGFFGVQRSGQVQWFLGEIFFNVFILDRRLAAVDEIHLFRDDIHGPDLVVLRKKGRNGQAHIAGARDRDFQVFVHGIVPHALRVFMAYLLKVYHTLRGKSIFSKQKSFLPIFAAIFCYFYALTSNAVGFYTYFVWMYTLLGKL